MKAGAVLYVKDLDRVCGFYRQSFGLKTAEATTDYVILESEEWTLSLVVVPEDMAATIEVPPRRRHNTPVKLAFGVAKIEDLRDMAKGLGVTSMKRRPNGSSGTIATATE